MIVWTLRERLMSAGLKGVLKLLHDNPVENLPKILDWVERFDRDGAVAPQLAAVRAALAAGSVWQEYARRLVADVDSIVLEWFFENLLVNATILGHQRSVAVERQWNCNAPWAILLDPTSACNLHCLGCWAADYGNRLNLTFDEMNDVVRQGKELGIFMYLLTGGEPLIRKTDVIRLCETHADCAFMAFTNGTLIDEAFCGEMERVGNFTPAISLEGFRETTDFRRGQGTFDRIITAAKLLKAHRLPFGFSCCYTRENTDTVGSEAFFDFMIDQGAKYAWFFTMMPIGIHARTDLMVTAEQREFMYRQIRAFRKTKPLFTVDFWNDSEYIGGCIAGGRCYLHINAAGDVEPCAFIHYSDSNIKQKTILDALRSPLFMAYRRNQPFSDNMLCPCPLLDNVDRLANVVETSGARSTDLEHPEKVRELCAKCHSAAAAWRPVANRLWHEKEKISETVL